MRITRDDILGSKYDNQQAPEKQPTPEICPKKEKPTKPLSESEIKKQLTILVDETIKQIYDSNKNGQDLEDVYSIFKGQMMVINKCRLLSTKDQQEQNARVYACYYQRKFEFKKLTLKNNKITNPESEV